MKHEMLRIKILKHRVSLKIYIIITNYFYNVCLFL